MLEHIVILSREFLSYHFFFHPTTIKTSSHSLIIWTPLCVGENKADPSYSSCTVCGHVILCSLLIPESQESRGLNTGGRARSCWESCCQQEEDYDPCLKAQRVIDTQSYAVPDNKVINYASFLSRLLCWRTLWTCTDNGSLSGKIMELFYLVLGPLNT